MLLILVALIIAGAIVLFIRGAAADQASGNDHIRDHYTAPPVRHAPPADSAKTRRLGP